MANSFSPHFNTNFIQSGPQQQATQQPQMNQETQSAYSPAPTEAYQQQPHLQNQQAQDQVHLQHGAAQSPWQYPQAQHLYGHLQQEQLRQQIRQLRQQDQQQAQYREWRLQQIEQQLQYMPPAAPPQSSFDAALQQTDVAPTRQHPALAGRSPQLNTAPQHMHTAPTSYPHGPFGVHGLPMYPPPSLTVYPHSAAASEQPLTGLSAMPQTTSLPAPLEHQGTLESAPNGRPDAARHVSLSDDRTAPMLVTGDRQPLNDERAASTEVPADQRSLDIERAPPIEVTVNPKPQSEKTEVQKRTESVPRRTDFAAPAPPSEKFPQSNRSNPQLNMTVYEPYADTQNSPTVSISSDDSTPRTTQLKKKAGNDPHPQRSALERRIASKVASFNDASPLPGNVFKDVHGGCDPPHNPQPLHGREPSASDQRKRYRASITIDLTMSPSRSPKRRRVQTPPDLVSGNDEPLDADTENSDDTQHKNTPHRPGHAHSSPPECPQDQGGQLTESAPPRSRSARLQPLHTNEQRPTIHAETEWARSTKEEKSRISRHRAEYVWSLFLKEDDVFDIDAQTILLNQLSSAFSRGRSIASMIETIDKHAVGNLCSEPIFPRPCLFANITNGGSAGKGGPTMTRTNCPYCKQQKPPRICCYAMHIDGVNTRYGPRVEGVIQEREYKSMAEPLTVLVGGQAVRWHLRRRKARTGDPN